MSNVRAATRATRWWYGCGRASDSVPARPVSTIGKCMTRRRNRTDASTQPVQTIPAELACARHIREPSAMLGCSFTLGGCFLRRDDGRLGDADDGPNGLLEAVEGVRAFAHRGVTARFHLKALLLRCAERRSAVLPRRFSRGRVLDAVGAAPAEHRRKGSPSILFPVFGHRSTEVQSRGGNAGLCDIGNVGFMTPSAPGKKGWHPARNVRRGPFQPGFP